MKAMAAAGGACLLELLSRDGAAAISIEPAEKVAAGLSR